MGFTGVNIIFLISAQNIDCGYTLEPPRRGGSNEYPQSMFLSENFKFLEVKFSIHLNMRLFVMNLSSAELAQGVEKVNVGKMDTRNTMESPFPAKRY